MGACTASGPARPNRYAARSSADILITCCRRCSSTSCPDARAAWPCASAVASSVRCEMGRAGRYSGPIGTRNRFTPSRGEAERAWRRDRRVEGGRRRADTDARLIREKRVLAPHSPDAADRGPRSGPNRQRVGIETTRSYDTIPAVTGCHHVAPKNELLTAIIPVVPGRAAVERATSHSSSKRSMPGRSTSALRRTCGAQARGGDRSVHPRRARRAMGLDPRPASQAPPRRTPLTPPPRI
jgi:hypothetical protein